MDRRLLRRGPRLHPARWPLGCRLQGRTSGKKAEEERHESPSSLRNRAHLDGRADARAGGPRGRARGEGDRADAGRARSGAVQPGLGGQVRPQERRARAGADAGHDRRLGQLHADGPLPRQARGRPAGVGDRPPLTGAGGHRDVRADPSRREEPAGDVRLLPRLPGRRHAAHPPHLRQRLLAPLCPPMGDAGRPPGRARRRAQGSRQGQAQGHPRRALAGRLADHRLRRLGLQRASRLQGHRRHGRDRRRPAGQLRLARLPGRDAGRDRRPQHRQPLRRPARLRDPRDHGAVRRGRRHLRAPGARTPRPRRCRASRCCRRSSTRRSP